MISAGGKRTLILQISGLQEGLSNCQSMALGKDPTATAYCQWAGNGRAHYINDPDIPSRAWTWVEK
jgi:hypothetical protein